MGIDISAGRYALDPVKAGGPLLVGDATDITFEIQATRES